MSGPRDPDQTDVGRRTAFSLADAIQVRFLPSISSVMILTFIRRLPVNPCPPLSQSCPTATPEALHLIKELLQYDPSKRPTAAQCFKFQYFSLHPRSRSESQDCGEHEPPIVISQRDGVESDASHGGRSSKYGDAENTPRDSSRRCDQEEKRWPSEVKDVAKDKVSSSKRDAFSTYKPGKTASFSKSECQAQPAEAKDTSKTAAPAKSQSESELLDSLLREVTL